MKREFFASTASMSSCFTSRAAGAPAQVVQSGEVPIGVFTGGAVINANLAGGDLVVIASSMNVMTFVVMARPEIKRPEDLKGKKIGVSRFGSSTDFGLRYVEEQWPVKRQRDFAVIQVGGVTDVYNALRAGALDAAVVNAELAILARREGYRELADISKMGINFPTSSIITTRSYIKRNENRVRKFVRGFVEGVHFAKTQRGPTIKIMQKYLRSSDSAMFDELYEMYIVRNIPRIPRPSPESLKTVMDQMSKPIRGSPISSPNSSSTRAFSRSWKKKASSKSFGSDARASSDTGDANDPE